MLVRHVGGAAKSVSDPRSGGQIREQAAEGGAHMLAFPWYYVLTGTLLVALIIVYIIIRKKQSQ